jgi:hypothetical protein
MWTMTLSTTMILNLNSEQLVRYMYYVHVADEEQGHTELPRTCEVHALMATRQGLRA